MKPIKTILHPTDFSANSASALELACSRARDQRARVILLHVVPHPRAVFWHDDRPARTQAKHAEEDLGAYLTEMEQKLRHLQMPDSNVPVEHHVRDGDVSAVIVRMAGETACGLIVMGTHGQRSLAHSLMGSVTEDVTRTARCPVVTISTPCPTADVGDYPVAETTRNALSVL